MISSMDGELRNFMVLLRELIQSKLECCKPIISESLYKRIIPIMNMNEIFMLRSVSYTIKNSKDLDSQLPKLVYCGLETITYQVPQLWQQLPVKIKKVAP